MEKCCAQIDVTGASRSDEGLYLRLTTECLKSQAQAERYEAKIDKLKERIDRGQDPEDARPGGSSDIGSANFGVVLIEARSAAVRSAELNKWKRWRPASSSTASSRSPTISTVTDDK